jgi:acyl-CoA synthetase (AMP-forming)/AMP-acid ligase II
MSSGLGWFCERLERRGGKTAAVWGGSELSYDGLGQRIASWRQRFSAAGLGTGDVCAIVGDQSSEVCAALLAGLFHEMIVVPLCSLSRERYPYCFETAQVQAVLTWGQTQAADYKIERRAVPASNPLLQSLRDQKLPGIVLFSSGSTGLPKAVLWDAERLVARHREARRAYRTLVFLRLDHIGGLNTLFHVLCGGETLVVPQQRDPETVCQAIERERVELLPTTPTFLKMLLLSGAVNRFDFSSLRRITYGTEPMHPGVLQSLATALPNVDFKQTYGLSEVGILPTQSADRDSLWLKLGGGDVQTRVVEGQLWIRTPTAMRGYLNHPSPFDSNGW